jgi:hypothetical protein
MWPKHKQEGGNWNQRWLDGMEQNVKGRNSGPEVQEQLTRTTSSFSLPLTDFFSRFDWNFLEAHEHEQLPLVSPCHEG